MKFNQRFSSYREYLRFLVDSAPEFEWLKKFFDVEPNEPQTLTLFLEFEGHKIRQLPDLDLTRLMKPPREVSTRVFMLVYQDLWLIDRNMLDTLALGLDIDPVILWRHFDHNYSYLKNPFCEDDQVQRTLPTLFQLPSTYKSLNIQLDQYGVERLMATINKSPESSRCTNVVLLFLQTHNTNLQAHNLLKHISASTYTSAKFPQNKLTEHYYFILSSWNKPQVELAEDRPIRFILPCIHFLQQSAWNNVERSSLRVHDLAETNLSESENDELQRQQEEISRLEIVSKRTARSLHDCQRFFQSCSRNDVAEAESIIYDFKSILESLEMLKDQLNNYVTRRTASISTRESRRSAEMADRVKVLTQIAFVFVPMNFSAAFFGADLKGMESGTVPFWAFMITTLLLIATTIVAWGFTTGLIQSNVRWRCFCCTILFATRTPYHAAMLFLCSLFETKEVVRLQFEDLALSSVLLGSISGDTADISKFPRVILNDSRWQSFKRARFHDIALFTSREDWQDDFFHRRALAYFARRKQDDTQQ